MPIAARGLNKARTPDGAYSAAILGVIGICTLSGAALSFGSHFER
jgi:hypothetical protein